MRELLFGPRTEWLAERRTYLGGTDVAAIVGRNKYKTPYEVWAEKTGKDMGADESGRHAQLGLILEPAIDKWVEEEFGVVPVAAEMIRHKEHPFLAVNPDRIITSADGVQVLGEYKSYGETTAKDWGPAPEGPIPIQYEVQVQMQMGITGIHQAWVFAIHRDTLKITVYTLEFDPEFYELLVAAGVKFHTEHVATNVPPELDQRDAYNVAYIFPKAEGEAIATAEDDEMVLRAIRLKAELKEPEAELDQIKDQLKLRYGDKTKLRTIHGDVTFSRRSKVTVDAMGLAIAVGISPALIEKHTKRTPFVQVNWPKN